MIVVTGATGQLGGLVVEKLLAAGSEVGVSVRSADKARGLAERGVRVREAAAYDDLAAMSASLEGARTVLVVSPPVMGLEGARLSAAAFEAARRAGVERVVYTSHQAASAASRFGAARVHAAAEEALAATGLRWTALRNGYYATMTSMLLAGARDGVLRTPADGPVSWTTHDDLAGGAAAVLLDDTLADGPTPPLTGPEAVDLAVVAERAGVRREVVGDEEHVASMVAAGSPEARARFLLGMFEAARAGEFDVVDPHLATLLGRPAARA
jgi:NAD(P)H dehydrogenase (quinone)